MYFNVVMYFPLCINIEKTLILQTLQLTCNSEISEDKYSIKSFASKNC